MSPVRIPARWPGESTGTRSARSPVAASTHQIPSVGTSRPLSRSKFMAARTQAATVATASTTARIRVWDALFMKETDSLELGQHIKDQTNLGLDAQSERHLLYRRLQKIITYSVILEVVV